MPYFMCMYAYCLQIVSHVEVNDDVIRSNNENFVFRNSGLFLIVKIRRLKKEEKQTFMEDREAFWYNKQSTHNIKKCKLPKQAARCKSQVLLKGKDIR